MENDLTLDFEALERVVTILKQSTFRGEGAAVVAGSLELLQEMKRQKLNQLKKESENEEAGQEG